MRGIVQTLAYRLEDIRARRNVEQTLVRLGVLHDGLCLAIHGENHGPLALSELPKKFTRFAPEHGLFS
jgi:hypothetical protein